MDTTLTVVICFLIYYFAPVAKAYLGMRLGLIEFNPAQPQRRSQRPVITGNTEEPEEPVEPECPSDEMRIAFS